MLFLLGNLEQVMVGHALSSLYQDVSRENTLDEPFIGWTYHQYPNQSITCLGSYTDANGLTKIICGDNYGFMYTMDDGVQDNGYDITFNIETGWSTLTNPTYKSLRDFTSITKKLRVLNVSFSSGTELTRTLEIDVDHRRAVDTLFLNHGDSSFVGPDAYCGTLYCGAEGQFTENLPVSDLCTGRKFRFRVYGTDSNTFGLREISCRFRLGGLREGVN
jgi:hypothetical protein